MNKNMESVGPAVKLSRPNHETNEHARALGGVANEL
jgi:hypothetical protein